MYLGMWGLLTAFNGYVAKKNKQDLNVHLNMATFIFISNITTF